MLGCSTETTGTVLAIDTNNPAYSNSLDNSEGNGVAVSCDLSNTIFNKLTLELQTDVVMHSGKSSDGTIICV